MEFNLSDETLNTLRHVLSEAIKDGQKRLAKAKRTGDYARLGGQLAKVIELQDIFTPEPVAPAFDVTATNQGTVFHFALHTDAVLEYVPTQFAIEDWQWLGKTAFAVDHRFAPQVVCILRDGGFSVEVR